MLQKCWVGLVALLFGVPMSGCDSGGVGDPCVPEEEYAPTFSGFSVSEVSTESRSFQCQSRLCLINHFQGRVSCPYGQTEHEASDNPQCLLPGSRDPVTAPVAAQLVERRTERAVYCSCRCAGPDPNARYCECPNGFTCSPVVPEFELGHDQLPGSYCIRSESEYSPASVSRSEVCDRALGNCDHE